MALIEEFKGLLASMAANEKAKVQREKKADTKKNRSALMAACQSSQIENLRGLLALGVPVNFAVPDASPSEATPMHACVAAKWAEGVSMLLDAGYSELEIPEIATPAVEKKGQRPLLAAVHMAAGSQSPAIFKKLWAATPQQLKEGSLARVSSAGVFNAVFDLGEALGLSDSALSAMAMKCLGLLDPQSEDSEAAPVGSRAFALAVEEMRRRGSFDAAALWREALKLDLPGVLQGLAAKGIEPPESMELSPSSFCNIYRHDKYFPEWFDMKHAPTHYDKNRMEASWSELGRASRSFHLAEVAFVHSMQRESMNNARALLSIPSQFEIVKSSRLALNCLAVCAQPKALELFKRLGGDLASLADAHGKTPLHWAFKNGATKAEIESLARLCISWCSDKDDSGKIPLDYFSGGSYYASDAEKAAKRQQYAVLFDQIAMREGFGGKLGSKAKPVSRRL